MITACKGFKYYRMVMLMARTSSLLSLFIPCSHLRISFSPLLPLRGLPLLLFTPFILISLPGILFLGIISTSSLPIISPLVFYYLLPSEFLSLLMHPFVDVFFPLCSNPSFLSSLSLVSMLYFSIFACLSSSFLLFYSFTRFFHF